MGSWFSTTTEKREVPLETIQRTTDVVSEETAKETTCAHSQGTKTGESSWYVRAAFALSKVQNVLRRCLSWVAALANVSAISLRRIPLCALTVSALHGEAQFTPEVNDLISDRGMMCALKKTFKDLKHILRVCVCER